jgi:chromosome segregation ATPase
MQTYSMAIDGIAVLATIVFASIALRARRRLRIAEKLRAEQQQDNELDRRRIQTAFERGQRELSNASDRLREYEAERGRLVRELEQQCGHAAAASRQITDAQAHNAALKQEQRALTDQLHRLSAVQVELQAQKTSHEETKKTLASARAQADQSQREMAETQRLLSFERLRLAEADKLRATTQGDLVKVRGQVSQLTSQLAMANSRLAVIQQLKADVARLETRNTELEGELAKVIQVASTVSAVELDREELQVRLATAAYSVRLARKEADHFRARAEGLEGEVTALRTECAAARAVTSDRESLSAEVSKLCDSQAQQAQSIQSLNSRLEDVGRALQLAEDRAARATADLEVARRALEDGTLQRQDLKAQVQTLKVHSEQAESLRAELASLSQVEKKYQATEAEIVRLQSELRAASASLRDAQSRISVLEQFPKTEELLREEQQSHLEAEERLLAAQTELRKLQGGFMAAHAKKAEGELLDRLNDKNRRQREEIERLRVHEQASENLERMTVEHRSLRLEWELLRRRVEELQSVQQELSDLRRLVAEQSSQLAEAKELRDRLAQLEAQLYALGHTPQTQDDTTSDSAGARLGISQIESKLTPLLERTQLRSAVLADTKGLPVFAAGDLFPQEGLAAFAALAGDMAQRAQSLLPLSNVRLVTLIDANNMSVSCRLFSLGQDDFAVAALGPEVLNKQEADQLVAEMQESMASEVPAADDSRDAPK